jgi:hypothetical protein
MILNHIHLRRPSVSQFKLILRIARGSQAEKKIKSLVHATKLSKANTRTNSQFADDGP